MEEALILERGSPAPVARIGRVLAYHFDLHPTDAIGRVRYGHGIVIDRAQPAKVLEVKQRLDEIGVATRIVPASELHDPPRGLRAMALELGEDELVARMVGGREVRVPRDEIVALDLFALEESPPGAAPRKERAEDDNERLLRRSTLADAVAPPGGPSRGLSPRGRKLLENMREAGVAAVKLFLTLYCAHPRGPVRIRKDDFDFSCLGRQKQAHSLDNFLILLDDVVAYLPRAWNRESAADFLQDLDPGKILRFKDEEVGNFDRWLMQWIRIEDAGARKIGRAEENP